MSILRQLITIVTVDFLKHLNKNQREAVEQTEGPLLVLAGPGSGKTRTLTHRIAHLIRHHRVAPESIIAVTFTNKAADEMRERVRRLLSEQEEQQDTASTPSDSVPFIGTFHRFCVRLLRRYAARIGFTPSFSIYDASDQERLLKQIMKNENIDIKRHSPSSIRSVISNAKSTLASVEEHLKGRGPFQDIAIRVADRYQSALQESNAMDFDDLITHAVLLLQKNDDVRNHYHNQFHYLHIDEYQDTNAAQYEFVRLLAGKRRNLFVVGDDAQSIYSWRAADFRNILNFENDYADARTIMLEQNYRSTQPILTASSELIRNNRQQKHKNLWTTRGGGDLVFVAEVASHDEEGEYILSIIRSALEEEKSLNDIAVLYRTNAQSRALEETLLHHSIPYRLLGSVRFFDRREIKDLLAYLTLFHQPRHAIAFERAIATPRRGVGPKTINAIRKKGLLALGERHDGVKQFAELLAEGQQRAKNQSPADILRWLIHCIDYRDFLKKTYTERNAISGRWEYEERWENIQELFSVVERFNASGDLGAFLEEAALFSSIDDYETAAEPRVTLMTLHAAKGLEFSTIIIVGCEEGLLPHANALVDPLALEEERRLCYVGMTRAKDNLHLLHARRRLLYGRRTSNPASRFLEELPVEVVKRTRLPLITPPHAFDNDGDEIQWL